MSTETHLEPISTENDQIRVNPAPIPAEQSVVDVKIDTEPSVADMAPKCVSAPTQPSVIKITSNVSGEKKSPSPSASSGAVDPRPHKTSSARNSKTVQDASPSSSRSSPSPLTSRTRSTEKRSGERTTAKRTASDKSQSSKSRSKGARADLEALLPKLGRVFEEQGWGHTMHRRNGPTEAVPTQRADRSAHRAPKYVRPVDGPRRRRQRSLLSSPSLVSILSTLTSLTSSSSGSNSTVTPESSTTSSQRPLQSFEENRDRQVDFPLPTEKLQDEKVDVFSYLEPSSPEDLSGWHSDSSSSSGADSDGYASDTGATVDSRSHLSLPDTPQAESPATFWQEQDAVHSDSGISMGDSSPDLERAKLHYQLRPSDVDVKWAETKAEMGVHASPPRKTVVREKKLRFFDQASPVKTYVPPVPPHVPPPRFTPAPPAYTSKLAAVSKPDPVGYGFLAATLSAPSPVEEQERFPVPLYRKFEPLNHRVLLHLQDELMDLEEQLQCMDDCIARQSYSAASYSSASPRADSRQGSILHDQRTEILGRTFLKLNQYNQFLVSYKASNGFETCSKEDVDSYKDWLRKFSPVIEAETRFLDRGGDLIRIPEKKTKTDTGDESASMAKYAYLIFATGILLTVVTFALVKSILGRLVLLCAIAGAGSWTLFLMEPEVGRMLAGEGRRHLGCALGRLSSVRWR